MGDSEVAPWQLKSMHRILSLIFLISHAFAVDAQNVSNANCVPASSANDLQFAVSNCEALQANTPYYLGFQENTADQTLKIVLAVPNENRWYGIGFNSKPQMVDTNCVIGWVNDTSGKPYAGAFHLYDTDGSGVRPDTSNLVFTVSPNFTTVGNNHYLTFELNLSSSKISLSNTIFAGGHLGDIPNDSGFTSKDVQHDVDIPTNTDFQTGAISVVRSRLSKKATAHGIINIVGWGLLLPLGAIIARYAKGYDPAWFYLHAGFQVAGFAFIIAGLVTGFQVDKLIPTNIDDSNHQALGVIIFVFASLQITALLLRPQKDAKLRRFWNWGHWWIGRVALLLGAINIFVGIHIASAGKSWKAAYAIILALEVVSIAILETFLWLNYFKTRGDPQLPRANLPNIQRGPPPAYPNWDGR